MIFISPTHTHNRSPHPYIREEQRVEEREIEIEREGGRERAV